MIMAMVQVWRIQDLVPALSAIKIQYLAPLAALLAFLVDSDPRRQFRRIAKNPVLIRLVGVLAFVIISIPTSLWQGESFGFLYKDFSKTFLLLVLMAASVRTIGDLERYALMHIGGAVYYSYYIAQNFRIGRSGRLGDLIYYDSNDLALLLVCTVPFCVYFLRPKVNPLLRMGATAVLAFLSYTLVQTGSRGGFLGLIACGLYLVFNFSAVSKQIRLYSIGALAAFMILFGGDAYWNMMASIMNPKDDYNWTADSGRKAIWKRGIGYMLTHPIAGVGASAFPQAEGTLSPLAERQKFGIGLKWSAAHNSFVQVGAELGVIGFGFFVASLVVAWRFVRKVGAPLYRLTVGPLGPYGHALGGVLVAYFVAGSFVSAGYSSFLYSIFALVIGAMKLLGDQQLGGPGGPPQAGPVRRGARPKRVQSGRPSILIPAGPAATGRLVQVPGRP
ncbi:MAG: O-antigen ligase family protein [Gemmatimonadales bacterium]